MGPPPIGDLRRCGAQLTKRAALAETVRRASCKPRGAGAKWTGAEANGYSRPALRGPLSRSIGHFQHLAAAPLSTKRSESSKSKIFASPNRFRTLTLLVNSQVF